MVGSGDVRTATEEGSQLTGMDVRDRRGLSVLPSAPVPAVSGWTVSASYPTPSDRSAETRQKNLFGLVLALLLLMGVTTLIVSLWWAPRAPRAPAAIAALAVLALVVELFPSRGSTVHLSLGAGFLLAACLLAGPVAGAAAVGIVTLLWSLGLEWLPWLRAAESPSLAASLTRICFRTGASAAVYLVSAWATFSILAVRPPVSAVTVENLLAALVLTVAVYLVHHVLNLGVAASSGVGVAEALRTVVPRSTLAELLAAPASLLLVVALERLGLGMFGLMALLYMGTMVLAWRGGVDRDSLRRRLADLERLHRAGEALSGTLELSEVIRRLHLTICDVVPFVTMLLILEEAGGRAAQVYAFDAEGRRREIQGDVVIKTQGRPEGLQADPEGGGVLIKDLPVSGAATARLRLDFKKGFVPTGQRLALLDTVCRQAAAAVGNAQLYRLANTDPLTGLAIRRYFERALRLIAARGEQFAVIMLDLDWFKRINDELGHRAGDEVLLDLAGVLEGSLRVMDIAVRYGGEEFVVLLPGASSPEAAAAAERIRRTLEQRTILVGGRVVRYTASFGVAGTGDEARPGDPMEIVWRADAALLAAKRSGRNQVVTAASL